MVDGRQAWGGLVTQIPGGLTAQLELATRLPAILEQFRGHWVEYGVLEHEYAGAHPDDFAYLVKRYGHTAIAEKRYSASSFLAGTLGRLGKDGHVLFHWGPATGRWDYLSGCSWWALSPEPDWSNRLSWEAMSLKTDYVPGKQE